MLVRLHTPNGLPGALWVKLWHLNVVIAWASDVRGLDVVWRGRYLVTTY